MTANNTHLTEYLQRLGAAPAGAGANLSWLQHLHELHLLSIPFENLDIHRGVPIRLELEPILDKLIRGRRGGFCYELNGAFHFLLNSLGFSVRMLSAQVFENGAFGEPYDHMALLVKVEGREWLCDVGFGAFSRYGLGLLPGKEQKLDESPAYRIDPLPDGHCLLMQKKDGASFQPVYRFSTETQELQQFEDRCRYHQTSPQSHFAQGKVCSIATPEGRKTLTNTKFVVTNREGKQTIDISSEAHFQAVLREEFGM